MKARIVGGAMMLAASTRPAFCYKIRTPLYADRLWQVAVAGCQADDATL